MFKVSFKETQMQPSRVCMKAGRNTIVTLRGTMEIPSFWHLMPEDIHEWVALQQKVELYEDISRGVIIVFSEGTSKCREDDKYDSLTGERLAESRAKYNIYKFLYDLTRRLYDHYYRILYGGVIMRDVTEISGENSGIWQAKAKYEALCIREAHHAAELLNKKDNG